MRRLASCLLVSLLLLGGCGPLPRPFQPDRKSFVQARDLPDEAQVAVAPLSEDAPGAAQRAAAALARSLENYGISTAAEGLPAATALAGRAEVEAADSGRDAIAITWELSGSEGEVVAIFEQRSELPSGLWQAGQPGAVGIVMAQAARDLAPIIKARTAGPSAEAPAPAAAAGAASRPQPAPTAAGPSAQPSTRASPPPRYRPRVVVLPMDGLPGDGSQSLPRALTAALRAADYDVGTQIDQGDLLVLGEVEILPTETSWERISITWWVVNANDGRDLGQIDQANDLPPGALNKPWGALADGIARGAVSGIVDLLERYARS